MNKTKNVGMYRKNKIMDESFVSKQQHYRR